MRVNVNPLDLGWTTLFFMLRRKGTWVSWIVYSLVAFLILFFFLEIEKTVPDIIALVLISLIGGLVGITLSILIQVILVMVVYRQKDGFTGEHEFYVEEAGLREKTHANDSLHHWASIRDVSITRRYTWVWINAIQAHILPRRSFPDDATYREFVGSIYQRWIEHRH